MRRIAPVVLLVLAPLGAHAALPGDAAAGKRLLDTYCMRCHDTSVYTRKDRQIQSLPGLRRQVKACGDMSTRRDFSAAETQDVVKYLNEHFYRFP